jgi:hypothetical protein
MRRISLFVLVVSAVVTASAHAQRIWTSKERIGTFDLDVSKAFLKNESGEGGLQFASFSMMAEARIPAGRDAFVSLSLPFARAGSKATQFSPSSSSTTVGNPWIGVEFPVAPEMSIEAGVWAGLSSEEDSHLPAAILGILDDFDRAEAWSPKTTTVRALLHYYGKPVERGIFTQFTIGASMLNHSGGGSSWLANYGLRVGNRGAAWSESLDFTGRASLDDGGSFDERTIHQLAATLEGARGPVRPRVSVKTYLDDSIRSGVSAIVLVGATWVF